MPDIGTGNSGAFQEKAHLALCLWPPTKMSQIAGLSTENQGAEQRLG